MFNSFGRFVPLVPTDNDRSRSAQSGRHWGVDDRLLSSFRSGDRTACARLISVVENWPERTPLVKQALFPQMGRAIRIGITGPPGAGKSTMLNSLVKQIRRKGQRVGVIAVDPSSPFTGGSFLGDRVRMRDIITDDGVFIRSMASREGRGGLSPSAHDAADVLDAFGMDFVFLETLGVGQAELDVVFAADLVVLILVPSAGDVIQALKAGIMEAADIFVVNKADLPGASDAERSVKYLLEMKDYQPGEWIPPIVSAVAAEGKGTEVLWDHIQQAVAHLRSSGRYQHKRLDRLAAEVKRLIGIELLRQFEAAVGLTTHWHDLVSDALSRGESPFVLAQDWARKIRVEVTDAV